jgi:hypothetical protein
MASDQFRYEQALGTWQSHIDAGNVSVPSSEGSVAILVPYLGLDEFERHRPINERLPALRAEANRLADSIQERGTTVNVAINAVPFDFESALKDSSVSDIILIGHGCLASVQVDNPTSYNRLDWEDLFGMSNHLKTGVFMQRVCATLPRKLNVPMGLLVVNNHRNVQALVGESPTTDDLLQYGDSDLPSVTNLDKMSYADIKQSFPQRKLDPMSRAHVALGALKNHILARNAAI